MNTSVVGNYVRRANGADVCLIHEFVATDWNSPPMLNISLTNNVFEEANAANIGTGPSNISILAKTSNYQNMTTSPNQNIAVSGNFFSGQPSLMSVIMGNTTGAAVTSNYFLNTSTPPIVNENSTSLTATNNTIDQTSSHLFVTDMLFNELAAYAPGSVLRLSAYNLGTLSNPSITLTDSSGAATPVAINIASTHALDVQIPALAGLGGAYFTLTAGAKKYFTTLFLDSQDNIPALNGCTYEISPSATSFSGAGSTVSILVVTQSGCPYQVLATDPFVSSSAPAVGTGVTTVSVTANSAGPRTTMIEIAGQPITLTQAASTGPYVSAVVNGASFLPTIAASSWITIQGSELSVTTRTWTGADFVGNKLPMQLDGVSVTVNGIPAYIYYISPTQLDVLSPDDSTTGRVQVVVSNSLGTAGSFTAAKAAVAPALFAFTSQYAAAVHLNGTNVGPAGLIAGATFTPAKPGETIELFGTGFGPTNPASPAGTILAGSAPLANAVTATVGGLPANVLFAGLSSNGLVQLNLTVPLALPSGYANTIATVNGVTTQLKLSLPINSPQTPILQGSLDAVTSSTCSVFDWARDPNNTAPIQVQLYRDGDMTSGTLITSFTANVLRTDLPFTDQNHGFNQSFGTNPLLADGKVHSILAFAVSTTGATSPLPNNGQSI